MSIGHDYGSENRKNITRERPICVKSWEEMRGRRGRRRNGSGCIRLLIEMS